MKDVEDNNVYLALDNHKSDEFVLKQNLAVWLPIKRDSGKRCSGDSLYSRCTGADEMAKSPWNLLATG